MTKAAWIHARVLRLMVALCLFAYPHQAFNAVSGALSPLNNLPRFALVIGNSRYGEAPLKNPGNDASAIAGQLQRMGFTVTLKLDATRQDMLETIQSFGSSLGKQKGVGLFYFAGHGAQLAWRNYLIPVDAQIEDIAEMRTKAVDLGTLLDGLTKAGNPMNVVILDACRDNPFGKTRVEQKGLSQIDAPPGTLLAYATSPGNVAADGTGANGLYTEYLLKEMQTREAKIEDIFKRVRLNVRRQSGGQQIPWESTSLEEDFYFQPPREVKKLTAAEAEKQFEEELAIWERIKASRDPAPLEGYIRKYPSGKFSELAQFRVDRLFAEIQARRAEEKRLARERMVAQQELEKRAKAQVASVAAEARIAEELKSGAPETVETVKPVQVASIAPVAVNPYSRGTGRADADFKVGDRYSYRTIDTLTRLETRKFTQRVTGLTDAEVIFNNGSVIRDPLGNIIKPPSGNRYSGQQFFVPEYSIGKKWTTRYRYTRPDGEKRDVEVDFKVVAREAITVPAGTFDAYKVEGEGFVYTTGFHLKYTYWIAPDQVRTPIVYEAVERAQGGRYFTTNRDELVAYSQRK